MPEHLVRDAQRRACHGAWIFAVFLATLAAGACNLPDQKPRPTLLTVADFEALLDDPAAAAGVVPDHGIPGGIPLGRIIGREKDGKPTLALRDTWTEGYRSGYLTTEIWTGFDEVWVQPVYVAISGYAADGTPKRLVGAAAGSWRPIFGVGAKSAFYSPYWQTFYFEVPEGADVDSFRSPRDVLERGRNLNAAEGRVMVLAPATVGLPPANLMPTNGARGIGGPKRGLGLLEGEEVSFLDFGVDTFKFNEELVVEEAPLFVLLARDQTGALRTLDIPTVAGTGPLYANWPAKVVNNQPHYGSYWRVYTVEVPKTMRVFVPPLFSGMRDALASTPYIYDATYDPAVLAETDPTQLDDYAGRVSTNPECFAVRDNIDPSNKTTGACVYLDSQPAIENNVPGDAIKKTDILVTCPFITYQDVPVVQ